MKTRKNSKLLILVLSLALLISSVFAITASAAEAETGDLYAVTINHNDKISVAFIVKATQAEITDGTVAVKYTWEGGEEQTAVYHSNYSEPGYVYVVTNGVAAYELGKTLTFTVYTNGVAGETGTYSVANFLYNKLYRDGATGAKKDVYETLLAYGAASQVYFDKDASNLVTEFDYAYTNNANVKFENGRNSIFGSTATATYSGSGNVEAWIINGEEIASSATTYEVTVDGVVSVDIKVQCVHADENKDHNCDYCGANEFGTCEDTDKNHKCDYCGATLSECADTDNDHYCNVCNAKLSDCVDAGKDHVCDICNGNVGGECADGNKDHNCDYCGEKLSDHTDNNNDHDCDYCGAEDVTECVDGNRDHVCDICGAAGAPCADGDGDYRCDACNKFSFNTNMTSGNNGVTIAQSQSNAYSTTASTVQHSNQITNADRPSGYDYGTYFSIVADPKDAANQVLCIDMPKRVMNGGVYLNSKLFFTPTGDGDLTVFDFDFMMDGENTTATDTMIVYLIDDNYNYSALDGTGEPSSAAADMGFQKIIFRTAAGENEGDPAKVVLCNSTIDAVAGQWISIRIVVDAATETFSVYYSTDDGQTYRSPNSDWVNRSTTYVDLANLTAIGFGSNTYKNAALQHKEYVDNVDAYKTTCFDFVANNDPWVYCSAIDANLDHVCDSCGIEYNCEDLDSNLDGKCDICGVRGFASNMADGENGLTIHYALSTLTSGDTTAESCTSYNTITNASKPAGQNRGCYYSITDDPTDATNSVLSLNVVMPKASGGGNLTNYIKVAPDGDDNARFIMLEADFYAVSVDASKNIFHFTAFTDAFDGVPGTGATKGFQRVSVTTVSKATASSPVAINIGGVTTSATTLEWVSVKYILDTVENKYYVYYSLDGGETFTALKEAVSPPNTTRLANYADVTYMGIETDTYQVTGGQAYVDNLKVVRVDTIQFGTVTLGSAE